MNFSKFCDIAKKYPNEKVQVFIDQSNLYKVIKSKYENYQANYKKLAIKLLGGRKLIRINIYVSTLNPEYEPEPSKSQHAWISFLQNTDSVTVKPALCDILQPNNGIEKKVSIFFLQQICYNKHTLMVMTL